MNSHNFVAVAFLVYRREAPPRPKPKFTVAPTNGTDFFFAIDHDRRPYISTTTLAKCRTERISRFSPTRAAAPACFAIASYRTSCARLPGQPWVGVGARATPARM